VPFGIPEYKQYIVHGLTSVLNLPLQTAKGVNLVVACDGFLYVTDIVHILVTTLITEVLFEQTLTCTAV